MFFVTRLRVCFNPRKYNKLLSIFVVFIRNNNLIVILKF